LGRCRDRHASALTARSLRRLPNEDAEIEKALLLSQLDAEELLDARERYAVLSRLA
jgi:hypothetical protein